MKICSLGPELFHANGQRDMTKLIVAFRSFANATKKPEPTFLFLLFVVCLLVVFRFKTKFVIMLCKFNDVISVVEDTGTFISDKINSVCRRDKAVIEFEQFNKLYWFQPGYFHT